GMHTLMRQIVGSKVIAHQTIGTYFASLLYMINPFTYDRLMAGQYNVLFGYALLPWFVRALLIFLERFSFQNSIILAVWVTAIGIASIHTLGMVLLLTLIGVAMVLWQKRKQEGYHRQLFRFGLLSLAIIIIASSYWLVPLVLGQG